LPAELTQVAKTIGDWSNVTASAAPLFRSAVIPLGFSSEKLNINPGANPVYDTPGPCVLVGDIIN